MHTKLVVLAILAAGAGQATTLTGSLKNPNGTGASGTLAMSLSQQAALLSGGACGGVAEIVPTMQVRIPVTAGALVGGPVVYGNDCMLPGGTYYRISFTDTNGNILFTDNWVITGSTLDIGTIVSATVTGTTSTLGSTGFVMLTAGASQTVNQPVGTNLNVNRMDVTTTLTLPDGSTCTFSGCFANSNAVTLTGNQTISGIKTFTGAGVISTLFNSSADGGATAFQTHSGTMQILGDGTVAAQQLRVNNLVVAPNPPNLTVASITSSGFATFTGANIGSSASADTFLTVTAGGLGGVADLTLATNAFGSSCWDIKNSGGTLQYAYSAGCLSGGAVMPLTKVAFRPTGMTITPAYLPVTTGGKQPLCIDTASGVVYKGSGGAC